MGEGAELRTIHPLSLSLSPIDLPTKCKRDTSVDLGKSIGARGLSSGRCH